MTTKIKFEKATIGYSSGKAIDENGKLWSWGKGYNGDGTFSSHYYDTTFHIVEDI